MGRPERFDHPERELAIGASAEQRVMEAIRRRFRRLGGAPSYTELSLDTGVRRSDLRRLLVRLERKGFVRLHPGVARGIVLPDRGAMLSDAELELTARARGATVQWPSTVAAALVDAYPLSRTDCELGLDALLSQIDAAEKGAGRHGQGTSATEHQGGHA